MQLPFLNVENGDEYVLRAMNRTNEENLLLHTLFVPISALQRKNFYSFTPVNSYEIFSSSLDIEKNRVCNNRFYKPKEAS